MKTFGVDANVVALSGIAIAIGTMVDMGIVVTENILQHLSRAGPSDNRREVIYRAASEVGGAVLTAVATTIVGFLPVFTMEAAEGKLFKPLAYTKTFALIASVMIALTLIPAFAHMLLGRRIVTRSVRRVFDVAACARRDSAHDQVRVARGNCSRPGHLAAGRGIPARRDCDASSRPR